MNHIYKVIWSKAKNAYVVTSEIANTYTKSAGSRAGKLAAVMAAAAVLSFGFSVPAVQAADISPDVKGTVTVKTSDIPENGVVTVTDVAKKSDLDKLNKAGIVAGTVTPEGTAIAIGSGSKVTSNGWTGAIAIGNAATVSWDRMKDDDTPASGWGMIAMGDGAAVKNSFFGVQIGAKGTVEDSDYAVAFGGNNNISNSYGATALGNTASVVDAKYGIALGAQSKVLGVEHAVAVGEGSVAARANTVSIGRSQEDVEAYNKYVEEYNAKMEQLHPGDDNYKLKTVEGTIYRKIAGVAAGTEANDVATVGQVKEGYVAYDIKDGTVNKDSVTLTGGEKGTALKNIGDITMKVPYQDANQNYKKVYNDRSFQEAGLMPGEVIFDDSFKTDPSNKLVAGNVVSIGHNAKSYNSSGSTVVGEFSNIDSSNWSTALGAGVTVTNSEQSVSIGNGSTLTNSTASVALGQNSKVWKSDWSQAIGLGANIWGDAKDSSKYNQNIALGTYSSVENSSNSVALGAWSKVSGQDDVVSVGNVTLQRKIVNVADGDITVDSHDAVTGGQLAAAGIIPGKTAGGIDNQNNPSQLSLAIGYRSDAGSTPQAYKNTVIGADASTVGTTSSTALGYNAKVGQNNSVALGANSVVLNGEYADGDGSNGVVSVGKTGEFTRRIINVKDGVNPTDAVNKSQLDAVSEAANKGFSVAIPQADGSIQQHTYKPGDTITFTSNNDNLLTDIADDGTIDVRLNDTLHLASVQSTNGKSALNLTDEGLALGYGDRNVSIDESGTRVNGHFQVTTGTDTTPFEVVGTKVNVGGVTISKGKITGVSAGEVSATSTDAVNGGQLQAVKDSVVGNTDQLAAYKKAGILAGEVNDSQYALGLGDEAWVKGDYSTAVGNQANVQGSSSTAFGAHATVIGNNSVAIGAFSRATEDNVVSVGGYDNGQQRRIVNVAAGVNDNDAVNKKQLESYVKDQVTSATENAVKYNGDGSLNAGNEGTGKLDLKTDGSADLTNAAGKGVHVDKDGKTTIDGGLNVTGGFQINGKDVATSDDVADLSGRLGTIDKQIGADKDGNLNLRNKGTTLVDGINKNTQSIGSINKVIGATGENGALKLDNGATTIESGINNNYAAIQQNSTAINELGYSVNKLGGEIDSVGALSAALAGLHPLDYDVSQSKYQLAAAFGGYDGSYALALGGFYNVDKDILLSGGVSTILKGDRKTAGNLGVTFRVGAGNSGESLGAASNLNEANQRLAALSQDNKVLAGQNRKLSDQVAAQDQKIAAQDQKLADQDKKLAELAAQVAALTKNAK